MFFIRLYKRIDRSRFAYANDEPAYRFIVSASGAIGLQWSKEFSARRAELASPLATVSSMLQFAQE